MNNLEKKKLFFKNKKGDVVYPVIIFVVLNIIFFSILLLFVYRSSTGTLIYEQFYAKQIALFVDNAEPDTKIIIDFEKGIEIAKNNGIISTQELVTEENNKIIVKLSDQGGYSFKHFSDNDVSFSFDKNNLVITVKEKNGK